LNKYVWTGLAIMTIWLAVLFLGLYGPDFTTATSDETVTIPTAWGVAPFAMIATIFVAWRGFRNDS
jgi:hypothetical protein